MQVLVIKPKRKPIVREIGDSLEEKQAIVGGLVQILYPFREDVALICNDEGKLLGLPANRGLQDDDGTLYDIVCGTFFLCGAPPDTDNFSSLTPEQIERYYRLFQYPELFIRVNGRLLCIPLEIE